MERSTSSGKKIAATLLVLALVVPSVNAAAYGRDDRGRNDRGKGDWGRGDHGRHHEVVVAGHDRYHYRDGRFYRLGWFGLEFLVARPPVGVIVASLPAGHRTVVVKGLTYYAYDNVYYTAYPNGYMVVEQPPAVSAPPPPMPPAYSRETVTVNVPNSNGSYTSVILTRRGNGYVGPQGEYYPDNPTVEQLKILYAR